MAALQADGGGSSGRASPHPFDPDSGELRQSFGGSAFAPIRGNASSGHSVDDAETRQMLNSRHAVEVLEGLKRVSALTSVGGDASRFFPDVVKNVARAGHEQKKLIYAYLAQYAHTRPDEALLAINALQKELASTNALARALALRAMTSVRLPLVAHLQVLAAKKCVADPSPFVRRVAVHALPKIARLDPSLRGDMEALLQVAFNDGEPAVLGSAVAALAEVCPERLDLLHAPFRKLCRCLADLDEWGQVAALTQLTRYCRAFFAAPPGWGAVAEADADTEWAAGASLGLAGALGGLGGGLGGGMGAGAMASSGGDGSDADDGEAMTRAAAAAAQNFYSDEEGSDEEGGGDAGGAAGAQQTVGDAGEARDTGEAGAAEAAETESPGGSNGGDAAPTAAPQVPLELDADHRLLLRCASALAHTQSAGVAAALASLFAHAAPAREAREAALSLVSAAKGGPREAQYAALASVATLAQRRPAMFRGQMKRFLIRSVDPAFIRALKLDILTHLANANNIGQLLVELEAYCRDPDREFVTAVVRALGVIADRIPDVAAQCTGALVRLCVHSPDAVAAEAALVARALVARDSAARAGDAERLLRAFPHVRSAGARAVILWMGGEFCDLGEGVALAALEMLRVGARSYAAAAPPEAAEVKVAILGLAAKLALRQKSAGVNEGRDIVPKLLEYVLNLARWDMDVDVRDKARLLRGVLVDGKLDGLAVGAKADGAAALEPAENTPAAVALLLAAKRPPTLTPPAPDRSAWTLGSLSHLVAHSAPGYVPLSEWAAVGSDSALRDPPVAAHHTAAGAAAALNARGGGGGGGGGGEYDSLTDSDYDSYTDSGSSEYTDSDGSGSGGDYTDDSGDDESDGGGAESLAEGVGALQVDSGGPAPRVSPEPEPEPEEARAPQSRRLPLLHRTDGRGLAVDVAFGWEAAVAGAGHATLLLYLTNGTASALGPVAVAFEDGEGAPLGEAEVARVSPQRMATAAANVRLPQSLAPLGVAIRIGGVPGGGSITARAALTPAAGALLRPVELDAEAFAAARAQRLEGGRAEPTKKVLLDPDLADARSVADILSSCANVASRLDEAAGAVQAAGEALDGSGVRYLLSLSVDGSGDAKVAVVGDDDAFAAELCAQVAAAMLEANDD